MAPGFVLFWNTTRQLNAPEREPQVGGTLFGVCLPIFNIKFNSKIISNL